MTEALAPPDDFETIYAAGLAKYLADHPAMFECDYPGNGLALFDPMRVGPNEKPWHELDPSDVRYRATSTPARFLSKGVRQAAARDPKLAWDETTRLYVRVAKAAGRPASAAIAAPAATLAHTADAVPAPASPSSGSGAVARSIDRPPAPHEKF